VFNIKPVDKTIAVKYPHFFYHSLMMSAEIALRRSQPLKVEARRCHLNPCACRACQMERSGEDMLACTGRSVDGVHTREDARDRQIPSCIHKRPNSIECEKDFLHHQSTPVRPP
jgi:hypothetical protein